MDKNNTNTLSEKANEYLEKLDFEEIPMGKVKAMAKDIKKDHELALELWSTEKYYPRLLASLIMDKKELNKEIVERMLLDLSVHLEVDALRISEWLFANQLMKSKHTIILLESYKDHKMPIFRRLYWYYQVRLRWRGKTDFDNTDQLMLDLESDFAEEEPMVQWAMNMLIGWIGVFDKRYEERCIILGKKVGLHIDQVVPKGCTPGYIPDFIRVETEKRS